MPMKPLAEARANFEAAATVVPTRYKTGVQRADWHGPASSDQAESNYAAGVQQAVSDHRRQRRIQAMSNQDWQAGAVNKGATIIGERMRAAAGKYEKNFAPIYQEVERAVHSLPQRTIDPLTNIDQRLKPIVTAQRRAAGKGV